MRTPVRWINSLSQSHLSLLTGALLSGAVGLACYALVDNTVEKDAYERFTSLVRSAQFTLLGRVKSYTDVLRGSASLFNTSPELSREQFHNYVEGLHLQTEFPGIETINYANRVTDAERPAFEQRMRTEADAAYHGEFKITPPGRRAEYLVLNFIEPASAWRPRFGADMFARPASVTVLNRARDTGSVSASGRPIALIKSVTGLGLRMPIYRSGMPTTTVDERRAAYIGSVGIGFSVERLMGGILGELPVRGMRMSLIGLAETAPGLPREHILLYDSANLKRDKMLGKPADDEFQVSLPIEFSERNWEADFRIKKSAMRSGIDFYLPGLALLVGAIPTALLYALFHTLASSRRHAIRLAQEMTAELRASEANLQRSNAKLRELAAHADNIKEVERKRIAREIHDDLGQNLLALRIEAQLLASRTGERQPLLHERARRTLTQIDTTIKSVRQIINDLRPNVLDLGLNAAVDWQIAQFERRTRITCALIETHQDIQINDRCATALFRILQESLSNISRHAKASRASVELRVEQDAISMSISDNGVGIRPGSRHKPGSYGLVGIEERINILGGTCVIGPGQLGGTTVSVTVPLATSHLEQPTTEAHDFAIA
jgi:signal transduction histidine kinase